MKKKIIIKPRCPMCNKPMDIFESENNITNERSFSWICFDCSNNYKFIENLEDGGIYFDNYKLIENFKDGEIYLVKKEEQ